MVWTLAADRRCPDAEENDNGKCLQHKGIDNVEDDLGKIKITEECALARESSLEASCRGDQDPHRAVVPTDKYPCFPMRSREMR